MDVKMIDKYIYDNNIDELERYFEILSIDEQKHTNDYLIKQLLNCKMPEENKKRNTVALFLSEIKCDEAVSAIIKLIKDEQESKHIGTLIYALQNLECAEYLEHIFHLLYSGNYEVRRNIFDLLEQNKDKITLESFEKMKSRLTKTIESYKDILLGLFITKEEIFND